MTGLGKLIGLDLALQIHESGNNISIRFGDVPESIKYGKDDPDAGIVLEECIYNKLK